MKQINNLQDLDAQLCKLHSTIEEAIDSCELAMYFVNSLSRCQMPDEIRPGRDKFKMQVKALNSALRNLLKYKEINL